MTRKKSNVKALAIAVTCAILAGGGALVLIRCMLRLELVLFLCLVMLLIIGVVQNTTLECLLLVV